MKNEAPVKRACINERMKNSEPCGIRSRDLWISGPENNYYKATEEAVGETYR